MKNIWIEKIAKLLSHSIDTQRWHKDMFVYLIANMDFKASVQLQCSRNVSKFSKHMALHVVGASGEFKQRENNGI